MNQERSGKVVKLTFKNEWSPNPNQTLYVHEIELDNGDKGSIYAKSKLPNEIQAGESIMYTFSNPEKTKIKYLGALPIGTNIANPPNQQQIKYGAANSNRTHYAKNIGAQQNNNNRKYMSAAKGLEGNIGYAFSYAKDHVGNTFSLYKDILVKRMDEKIQRMLSSGKYEYLSDIPLRELFDEEMELFLKTARYNFEQMGSDELRAYDGSVNVEEELRVKNELVILSPLKKDLGVTSNEAVKSQSFPSDYSSSLDTDFDVEEHKQDDFLKEINEVMPSKDELSDLNSAFDDILEDKKGKKKK